MWLVIEEYKGFIFYYMHPTKEAAEAHAYRVISAGVYKVTIRKVMVME